MPSYLFVEPSDDGWIVRGDFADSPRTFPTGAGAEEAARDLAQGLADDGALVIRLRDGARAGRFLFPPHGGAPEASARRA
ncbi:DUF2188 domain-containing protein [Caulobacter endophyticus]|nr:DUF2188 domain-containing protein [Caulobacter endophyticus]